MTNREAIEVLKEVRANFEMNGWDEQKSAIDMAISALEAHDGKKKTNIKRLPCTCGRKWLEKWWSNEEGNKGWFYKCPCCGKRSKIVKEKCRLNEAWNEMVLLNRAE